MHRCLFLLLFAVSTGCVGKHLVNTYDGLDVLEAVPSSAAVRQGEISVGLDVPRDLGCTVTRENVCQSEGLTTLAELVEVARETSCPNVLLYQDFGVVLEDRLRQHLEVYYDEVSVILGGEGAVNVGGELGLELHLPPWAPHYSEVILTGDELVTGEGKANFKGSHLFWAVPVMFIGFPLAPAFVSIGLDNIAIHSYADGMALAIDDAAQQLAARIAGGKALRPESLTYEPAKAKGIEQPAQSLDGAEKAIREEASLTWLNMQPLLELGGEVARTTVMAFIERYQDVSVSAGGELRKLRVPELTLARDWLANN